MKQILCCLMSVAVASTISSPIAASTFLAQGGVSSADNRIAGSCSGQETDNKKAEYRCEVEALTNYWNNPFLLVPSGGTALASASGGRLSAFANTYYSVGIPFRTTSAFASASFTDEILVRRRSDPDTPILFGSLVTTLDILGSLEVSFQKVGNPGSHGGSISARIVGSDGSIYEAEYTHSVADVKNDGSPPVITITKPPEELIPAEFKIRDGKLGLEGFLNVSARCTYLDGGSSDGRCRSTADASTSLRLLSSTVLDENGDVIDDVVLISQSGHDYLTGVAPHDRSAAIPPVPLPATFWLMIVCLTGVFVPKSLKALQNSWPKANFRAAFLH